MMFVKAAFALYLSAVTLAASLGRDSQEADSRTFRMNPMSVVHKLIITGLANEIQEPAWRR